MAYSYYQGHSVSPPYELQLWILLQRLPGYTRATLEAEDADLVEAWQEIMRAEAAASHAKTPAQR